jgi:very-short-patch-repair endonuclease
MRQVRRNNRIQARSQQPPDFRTQIDDVIVDFVDSEANLKTGLDGHGHFQNAVKPKD